MTSLSASVKKAVATLSVAGAEMSRHSFHPYSLSHPHVQHHIHYGRAGLPYPGQVSEHRGVPNPRSFDPTTEIFNYTQDRQLGFSNGYPKSLVSDYVSRQLPGILKEKEYSLGSINKIFAASWVSDRQVVFGTKCNKLIVMDLHTKQMAQIPSINSTDDSFVAECPCGIHAIATNPSNTLLATGAKNTNDLAIYKLPTFDPVCIGEQGHKDWIFDIKWLDDQFLVTGSRDNKMCLWRVCEENTEAGTSEAQALPLPEYSVIEPEATKRCRRAEKVRALAYNDHRQELAALSLNALLLLWDAQRFTQKSTIKLKHQRENVCMSISPDIGLYAVGSQSHVTLVDPRNVKDMTSILSEQRGSGIRSVNFNLDMLSIGTGNGAIYFYDLRAQKYLDQKCGHTLALNASKGWLMHDDTYRDFFMNDEYPNAIYAHCYDNSGTRLFAAGGPLPAGLWGNYAGLWH